MKKMKDEMNNEASRIQMPSIQGSNIYQRHSMLNANETAGSFISHDDQSSILNDARLHNPIEHAFKTIQNQSLSVKNRYQNNHTFNFGGDNG